MRKTTQAKVARLLTSSLMSSDLSNQEVIDFCHSLMSSDPFLQKLGYHLQSLVGNTMYTPSTNEKDDEIEYVYSLIKKRKLTRDALLEIINEVFNGLGEYWRNQKVSIKTILELAREHATINQWATFINILTDDDYLNHVLSKVIP